VHFATNPKAAATRYSRLSAAVSHGGGGPRRAFTIVELVLTLSLIGIISAIAAPRYAAALSNYRARLAAHRVAADVAMARAAAKASSSTRTMTFNLSSHAYTIDTLATFDMRSGLYTVSLSASPYAASISSVVCTDSKPDNAIAFDGYGVPDSGATITVRAGTAIRQVVVDAETGAAKVQ
jgi:prepilin-type N-terminal cleavage/methylation domain-containing protein